MKCLKTLSNLIILLRFGSNFVNDYATILLHFKKKKKMLTGITFFISWKESSTFLNSEDWNTKNN